jgi:hypothetical protein
MRPGGKAGSRRRLGQREMTITQGKMPYGQIVLAGAEAWARDLGRKQQWDKWARGCSELEFVQIARVELELGKVYCDRYSQ